MRQKNKLVAFEGIDGSGKTTLSRALVRHLRTAGIPAVYYRPFRHTQYGFDRVRRYARRHAPPDASLLLYVAMLIDKCSALHEQRKQSWVICDRFLYTTLAQHYCDGANLDLLNLKALSMLKPDVHLLLTVREDIRIKRLRQRGIRSAYDLRRKRTDSSLCTIESVLKHFGAIIIDNNGTKQEALEKILTLLRVPKRVHPSRREYTPGQRGAKRTTSGTRPRPH